MFSLIAPASTHYQDVYAYIEFGNVLLFFTLGIILLGAGLSIIPSYFKRKGDDGLPTFGTVEYVGLGFIGLGVLSIFVWCFVIPGLTGMAVRDNIKEKYGAGVWDRFTITEEYPLIEGNEYTLRLPNGTKSTYNIRFDRDTSEPVIVGSDAPPTGDQLEKDAKK